MVNPSSSHFAQFSFMPADYLLVTRNLPIVELLAGPLQWNGPSQGNEWMDGWLIRGQQKHWEMMQNWGTNW
jgi:hypothetical protein